MTRVQKAALTAILAAAGCGTACLLCFAWATGLGGLNGLPIHGSPLFAAVRQKDEARVKKLLGEGADPNTMSWPDAAPKPMLFWAIDQDNNIARLLLEHGTDPNPVINYGGGESSCLADLPLKRHKYLLKEFIEKKRAGETAGR